MLAKQKWQVDTIRVLEDVFEARLHQEEKHGVYGSTHDFADGTGPDAVWIPGGMQAFRDATTMERVFRADYEEFQKQAEDKLPTWMHLVREEVAEAFKENDPDLLEDELLQVAALCVSWVEKLRLRKRDELLS